MNTFFKYFSLVAIALLQFSASVFAGTLDDYYLQRFGEATTDQFQKAVLSVTADVQDSAQCGMPLKHDLRRDWDLLEQTTQKVLAKQLAYPVLTGELTHISSGSHFTVHYAASGTDAPPATDTTGIIGVPDWVETVAATFETIRASYIALGYNPVPTSGGVPYDIYLRDLAPQGYYGVTTSGQPAPSASYPNAYTSWMEIDNDFTDSIYHPTIYTPLQSLQITAAHEYQHAIHYGYTIYFDVWYAEAASTWMEDELYDNVNQLYSYISAWFFYSTKSLDLAVDSNAVTSGAGYGRWIFNRYLAEEHTPGVVQDAWQKLAGLASPGGGADIPMAPVLDSLLSTTYNSSLGNEFFGFAKRVYTRNWTTHTNDLAKIPAYFPVATYSSYPVNSTKSPKPYISLPAYSFAYYKFIPTSNVPTLTVYINKTSGIQAALFKKVSGATSEIAADASGTYYIVNNFSFADEVVLLIANTSSTDGHSANFSTDSMPAAPTEPTITPTTTTTTSTGSGGGSGCFIATAAYGSYLHPKVQLLRIFRDQYLLTNAPGRAFVATYYRYSPPLADFIASHDFLRATARLALTPLFIAVIHPLGTAVALLLMAGLLFRSLRRRTKAGRALPIQGAQTTG